MAGKEDLGGSEIAAAIRNDFDEEFYRGQLSKFGISTDTDDYVRHYVEEGIRIGLNPTPDFSSESYLRTYPEVAAANVNPFWHYVIYGRIEGRNPRGSIIQQIAALIRNKFDQNFYLLQLSARSIDCEHIDLVVHYLEVGAQIGLDPCEGFSTLEYANAYPDVVEAGVNPFFHYLSQGQAEGRSGRQVFNVSPAIHEAAEAIRGQFDEAHYREQLELRGISLQLDADAVMHYLELGTNWGLDPCPAFSTNYYLTSNLDVGSANINPFWHYIVAGRNEGRASMPPPDTSSSQSKVSDAATAEFDGEFYLKSYPDVFAAGIDPLNHFFKTGWKEGRNPNRSFSVTDYLESYPDVKDAGINPFVHYVTTGRAEGRSARQDLGFQYEILKKLVSVKDVIEANRREFPDVRVDSASLLSRYLSLAVKGSKGFFVTFSHDDFTTNVGGVQLCLVRESSAIIAAGFAHLHLFPSVPLPVVAKRSTGMSLGVLVNGKKIGAFEPLVIETCLGRISKRDINSLVAVHSLLGHDPSVIIKIAKAAGAIRGWFWIHDFSSVCAGYNLLRNDVEYCDAPSILSGGCMICKYVEYRSINVVAHTKLFNALELATVAPSESALSIWQNKSKYRTTAEYVQSHCKLKRGIRKSRGDSKRPVRVAFLGYPSAHKGWYVFQELVQKLGTSKDLQFFHLGRHQDPAIQAEFVEVAVTRVDRKAMVNAIKRSKIDVAFIWSLWPETFCFTAYEAISGGAVVFTNRASGNVAHLAQRAELGQVFENENALREYLKHTPLKALRSCLSNFYFDLEYSRMSADLISSSAP